MFRELMPLIQRRPLTITVAFVGEERIRVNVIPQATEKDKTANKQIGHSQSKEVAEIPENALTGLTTPLCLTGTAAEIDAELANTLNKFTTLHMGLQESFDIAASAIRDSVRAIEERESAKKEKDKEKTNKKTPAPKTEEKKPVPEPTLPFLWTTQAANTPLAVSANDAAPGKTASGSVAKAQTETVNDREDEDPSDSEAEEVEEETIG